MINHRYKCVFVHVPRTSGTSVECMFGVDMDMIGGKHSKASDIFDIIGKTRWEDYFKFTIVRNPWDRVISHFHQPYYHTINNLSGKNLKYFLNHYKPAPHESGVECSDYIDRDDLDFIGKFENRQQDIKHICDVVGLTNLSNIHKRRTKHKHYTEYYDDETREMVKNRYAKDIKYFDYEFGK